MKVYEVPYGKGSQQVLLPEEKVSQVLLPPVTEHPRTVEDLMRDALDHPIGSPKLDEIVRAGDKVVLVVSDITRTWAMFDKFVPILVAELNKIGVPDDDISVIIATGKHRLNTARKKRKSWARICTAGSRFTTTTRRKRPASTTARRSGVRLFGSTNGPPRPTR